VRLFFIGTADPTINAARVAARVIAGGHSVPIEKIVRRYSRSIANLTCAIELADRVYIYDNSVDGADARLCVRTEDAQLRKVDCALPSWVDDAVAGLPHAREFVDLRSA
jgi:predicted ABC-type ATPase